MTTFALTMRLAFLEAWSNRRGFWTQVTVMLVNDLVWITFWVVFFQRVGEVRGWDREQVFVLLAVLTTAGGIVLGLFYNVLELGRMAATGELDAALALPVRPLTHLLARRVNPVHLGDIVFGVVLFAGFCDPTPVRTAAFAFGVVCAVLVLTGFLVVMGSLSFFVGRTESGELGFHAMILFAAYPVDIFAGVTKMLLYTVVPAGFMTAAPVRMVESFDPRWAAATFAVGVALMALGWFAFERGLRRYTSGSVWVTA